MGVTFFWVGVRDCDNFLVGVGVTFFWVGVGGCDIFLGRCT